jgi:hypothetical protein
MPDFVYLVPFHFLNSSILVEAWFAAPTFRERRELIDWPTYVDTSSKHRLPISRVWSYEEMPPDLYRRTGSGNRKTPRLQLHPNLELIYSLLKKAIRHGNIRIKWRVRYQVLLTQAAAKSLACRIETQRRLFLSLIFGDVRDLVNYHPPGTILPYDVTSTVEEVLCVPVCRQNITISTIPGFSLPAIGPYPRLPSHSFYERVRDQIAVYRGVLSASPPLNRISLANSAMAEHALIWARELIESTRDPACPDPAFFPSLEQPATHPPDDVDMLFPALERGRAMFEDDEDDGAADINIGTSSSADD